MNDHGELGPEVTGEEAAELMRLAERLQHERPLPAAAFRGALGRHLATRAGAQPQRPRRLGALIAGFAGSGTLLLVLGALGAAGTGPLGA